MNIIKTVEEGVIVVRLEGRLDSASAPQLDSMMKEIDGSGNIVFDLSKLEYVSSAGLRVFLSVQKRVRAEGSMKIINSVQDVMEIFEVTGFVDILDIA